MEDLLKALVPTVFSAAIAGAIALAGLFASTRRLRKAIAADADLLELLPSDAKAEMKEEIRRRGFGLIALIRWPSLTKYEVLCILGLVLTAPTAYWFMWDVNRGIEHDFFDLPSAIISGGGMFAVPYLIWRTFYGSWSRRTHDRLMFLKDHLLDDEFGETFGLIRLANRFAIAAYLPSVIYPIAYLMWTSDSLDWNQLVPILGSTAIAAILGFVVFTASVRDNDLFKLLLSRGVPTKKKGQSGESDDNAGDADRRPRH